MVQIARIEHYGKMPFPISTTTFSDMEVIKFVKPIQADCELGLKLHWKARVRKLYVELSSIGQACSLERLIYAGGES